MVKEAIMASIVTLESAKQAVFFPFRGKNWGVKLLIGSALALASYFIPLLPAIPLMGYYAGIMKKVILQDADPELPEWNDWGTLILDGLKVGGVIIIYMLPAIFMIVAGYILFFVLNFAFAFSVTGDLYSNYYPDPGMFFGSMAGMFGGMIVIYLGFFVALVTALLLPPALGNLIAKGDFGAAFRIREWWPVLKANWTGYILAIAISFGVIYLLYAGIMILYVTVVLCFLLPFAICILSYLLGAIQFSLYSIAYRDSLKKLAEAK
jgi:hypothetical protein